MPRTPLIVISLWLGCATHAVEPDAGSTAAGDASIPVDATAPAAPTFAAVYSEALEPLLCPGCHTTGNFPGTMLRFGRDQPGGLHAAHVQLVGAPAWEDGPCAGETIVVPGDCASSVLYQKLTTPTCGTVMPPARPEAPSIERVQLVCRWIEAGAPF